MKKIYTGIGSRNAPKDILNIFENISSLLSKDYILRSGGAVGCDCAFEKGCLKVQGEKEIYLPWKGFGKKWGRLSTPDDFFPPKKEAYNLLGVLLKKYKDWNPNSKKWVFDLTARNIHQVLGKDLSSPSDFVICWTPEGLDKGGTRWAIRVARELNITIYNFAINSDINKFKNNIIGEN